MSHKIIATGLSIRNPREKNGVQSESIPCNPETISRSSHKTFISV